MRIQKCSAVKIFTIIFATGCFCAAAMADDDVTTNLWTLQNSRFGLFDALDHRSAYYQDGFPEPLLVDETEAETEGELEIDVLRTEASGQQSDIVAAEFEDSLNVFTFEMSLQYQRFSDSGGMVEGLSDLDLGARCPLYQFVSPNRLWDDTFGVALESAIPVNTAFGNDVELDPEIFDDLKLGDHFSIQSVFDYSALLGGGDDGGAQSFEYGFDFAYTVRQTDLPLPGVLDFSPMLELSGELGLNEDEAGQNSALGSIGLRVDFKPIGEIESSAGLGYVFPVDNVAREEVHWGIAASFTIEF